MAKNQVEQRVKLNADDYRKTMKQLASETGAETKRVSKNFEEAGKTVRDFGERTKKQVSETNSVLKSLAKGFSLALGGFSAVSIANKVRNVAEEQIGARVDFSKRLDRLKVRTGLNEVQAAGLGNQILDVSSKTNVDREQVAAAAEAAIGFTKSADEALRFAEVMAKASKLIEGGNAGELAATAVKDLRGQGLPVTAENAKRQIEALIAGTRQGFQNLTEVSSATGAVGADTRARARLTDRDLVNLFGAARTGVSQEGGSTDQAIRDLIKVSTDQLGGSEMLQGILGSSFKDATGKFDITSKSLDKAAEKLDRLGDTRIQREVLQQAGFSEQGTEGLLSLVRDRRGFASQRARFASDQVGLDQASAVARDSIGEKLSGLWNRAMNSIQRDTSFSEGANEGLPFVADYGAKQAAQLARQRAAGSALPLPAVPGQGAPLAATGAQPVNVTATAKIEIVKAPDGFTAKPVAENLPRNASGVH